MTRDRSSSFGAHFWRWFGPLVALSFLAKLWMTSVIRILPVFAPADASNFLEHAAFLATGRWFGPYDNMTLVKQPFFPLYLAGIQQLGIPLTIAHLLLDAFAAAIACIAVAPLIRSRLWLATLFLAIYFSPFSYDTLAWLTYRSQVNPALALLSLACATAIYIRRREPGRIVLPWFAGLSAAYTAFWLTREEAIWLLPCIAIILSFYLGSSLRRTPRRLVTRLVLCCLPPLVLVTSVAIIKHENDRQYGWAITNEQQSPEFVSAYNSLARIKAPYEKFFPVPKAAREIAYRVSPAARELEPSFEGDNGVAWHDNACAAMPQACSTQDIPGGWFQWALRDATSAAGHYSSGATARAFYIRLASELDSVCDRHVIACGPKGKTVFPPVQSEDIPHIIATFGMGLRTLLTLSTLTYDPWQSPAPTTSLRRDYDFVVRDVDDGLAAHTFSGWMVYEPFKSLEVDGPGGETAQITFREGPDIAAAFASKSQFAGYETEISRFEIASNCGEECTLHIALPGGRILDIPLNRATTDFKRPGIIYHLDSESNTAIVGKGDTLKNRLIREFGRDYTAMMAPVVGLAIVLFALRLLRTIVRRRIFGMPDYAVVCFAVSLSICGLLAILSVIAEYSFPTFNSEYMGAMVPLVLFSSLVTLGIEGAVVVRFVRARLPRPAGTLQTS